MNEMSEVAEAGSSLVPIEKLTAVQVFRQGGVDDVLARIRREVMAVPPDAIDISTPAGRKARASLAYKVTRSKTALDEMGKALNDEKRKAINTVDAERRNIRASLDALAEEIRAPLVEWEGRNASRIAAHERALAEIQALVPCDSSATSTEIGMLIESIPGMADRDWEEFKDKASRVVADVTDALKSAHLAAVKREDDAAELARLRAAEAERVRVAAHERALADIAEAPDFGREETSADFKHRLRYLRNYPDRDWEEFAERARAAIAAEIERTEKLLADAEAREAAARQEREERIAAEAAQRAREEAEARAAEEAAAAAAKAEHERQEAAQREREALEAAERAERSAAEAERRHAEELARAEEERVAAQERADREAREAAERAAQAQADAVEAERRRAAEAAAAQQAEADRRAADKAHRAKINRAAANALMAKAMITENDAIAVIAAIARGEVPAVRIAY